jgi:hypothetical protein
MSARIYSVKNGDQHSLVKAVSKNAAVAFVARTQFSVTLPTQEELFNYGQEGMKIIDATVEKAEEPAAAAA